MSFNMIVYYENYSPVGDVLVMATCLVFAALIRTAYINRTKNFLYLRDMIVLLFVSAMGDTLYHIAMNYSGSIPNFFIYLPRFIFHGGLFGNLWLYVLYMKQPLRLEPEANRRYFTIATVAYIVIMVADVIFPLLHWGFYIDAAGTPHDGIPVFPFGYFFFVIYLVYILLRFHRRIFRQVVIGVMASVCVAVLIVVIQQIYGQSSFTAASFLFPIYALLYLVHANPYDLEIGAVNESAFEELIAYSYQKKEELLLMSLFMHDFDGSGRKYPQEIHEPVRVLSTQYFRNGTLFQISGGHLILAVSTARNPDYTIKAQKLLDAFAGAYPKFRLDYKLVFTRTFNKISAENDYVGFIHYLHERMEENSFLRADDKAAREYLEDKYIIRELADINARGDLEDPRVEVYCQPVYNLNSNTYDTAEALMRLRLPETGMLYPERFIPIAEKQRVIGILSKIILHKTCKQIKNLTDAGYHLRRVSINFSLFDVREEDFTGTVERIIRESGASNDQVAIEITESQNEQDFEVIKAKVNELKDSGIKFYLDDFGTGYSNFERIMELPFDIIKFDRSLVIASDSDSKIRMMVAHLAKMFSEMNYAVLYEGVENDEDEARCRMMSAKYLQGYKYSRPIPIERLSDYLEKRM